MLDKSYFNSYKHELYINSDERNSALSSNIGIDLIVFSPIATHRYFC